MAEKVEKTEKPEKIEKVEKKEPVPEKKVEKKVVKKVQEKPVEKKEERRLSKADQGRRDKEKYYENKKVVYSREDRAHSKIIAIHQKQDWFRFVGSSALIFHYEIAPKIGYKSKWYKDDDFKYRVEGGIVNIRNMDTLIAMMKAHHYDLVRRSEKFVIFNAGREYSLADIDALHERVKSDWERVNKTFVPKDAMPTMFRAERDLMFRMYQMVRKMDACAREIFGNGLIAKVKGMMHDYIDSCNHKGLERSGCFDRTFAALEWIEEELACVAAVRAVDIKALTKMGYAIQEVKLEVNKWRPKG